MAKNNKEHSEMSEDFNGQAGSEISAGIEASMMASPDPFDLDSLRTLQILFRRVVSNVFS